MLDTFQVPFVIPVSGSDLQSDFDRSVQVPVYISNLVTAVPNQILIQFEVREFVRKTIQVPSQELNFPDSTVFLKDSLVTISFNIREDMEELIVPDSFKIIADFDRRVKSDSSIQPLIKGYPKLVDHISIDSDRLKINYVD